MANLSKKDIVEALSALAHEHRLALFRILVEAGMAGLSAGDLAARLKMRPSSLSFHTQKLVRAKLLKCARKQRQIIYAVNFPMMKSVTLYLSENCCGGAPC